MLQKVRRDRFPFASSWGALRGGVRRGLIPPINIVIRPFLLIAFPLSSSSPCVFDGDPLVRLPLEPALGTLVMRRRRLIRRAHLQLDVVGLLIVARISRFAPNARALAAVVAGWVVELVRLAGALLVELAEVVRGAEDLVDGHDVLIGGAVELEAVAALEEQQGTAERAEVHWFVETSVLLLPFFDVVISFFRFTHGRSFLKTEKVTEVAVVKKHFKW